MSDCIVRAVRRTRQESAAPFNNYDVEQPRVWFGLRARLTLPLWSLA